MIYLILALFIVFLVIYKGRNGFIDVYPLYCLFFDVFNRFAGSQNINISYVQSLLVLVFVALYLLREWPNFKGTSSRLLLSTLLFLALMIVLPVIRGQGIDPVLRSFAINSQSILVLPIAYHYYSKTGNIKNLYKAIGLTTVLWVFAVIVFTFFKIDTFSGKLGSDAFGLGLIYFGQMSSRGALSYIGLLLLAFPLVQRELKGLYKISYMLSCLFILVVMAISLKRFTLVAVGIGLLNILLNTGIELRRKGVLFGGLIISLIVLLTLTDLPTLVAQSYFKSGGERKISVDAASHDLRIYEPYYIIQGSMGKGFLGFLFGSQNSTAFDIESESHYSIGRSIHNQYGQYLLIYGLIGLIVYLSFFVITYKSGLKEHRVLKSAGKHDPMQWVTFQNMVFIFAIGGMVGGHIHVTYRSIAFILMGGLGGTFLSKIRSISNTKCNNTTVTVLKPVIRTEK